MKDTTVKLSGHSKDRFLEHFFAAEPSIDPAALQRLTARSKLSFTSLRVRKALLAPQRKIPSLAARQISRSTAAAPEATSTPPPTAADPPPVAAPAVDPVPAFDPYVFGLVPVFQREGRDGLLAKLAEITNLDQLRQMAKAQQVILPQQLRSGDATLEDVRTGIVEAVAKRIADRRAAAG